MAPFLRRHGEEFLVAGVIAAAVGCMIWGFQYVLPEKAVRIAAAPREELRDAVADAPAPTELERLFNRGVEAYVHRDMAGARTAFAGMARLDPGNKEALNGLKRVSREK